LTVVSNWSELESGARSAREQASDHWRHLDVPGDALERVAYWSELAHLVDVARWDAIGEASDAEHPWWTIGLAAGADPEGLRQKYRRRTSS